MASKLISQASCIHLSAEANFEGEIVGEEGSYEKEPWNSLTFVEAWINHFFVDERLFGIECNSGTLGRKDTQNIWKRECTEFDWLSEKMAFQEIVPGARPTSLSDLDSRRDDLYRDEHEADVISTFTALATIFRDWHLLEKDLTEPEKISKCCWGCGKYRDFWDSKLNAGNCFRDFSLDLSAENFWTQYYRNQQCQNCVSLTEHLCDTAQAVSVEVSRGKMCVYGKENLEDYFSSLLGKEAGMYGKCELVNSNCSVGEDDFVRATRMKGSIMAADDRSKYCSDEELCSIFGACEQISSECSAGEDDFLQAARTKGSIIAADNRLKDGSDKELWSIFGKQISAASRFSFGRDGSEIFLANSDFSEKIKDSKDNSVSVQNNDSMAAGYKMNHHCKKVESEENNSTAEHHGKEPEQVYIDSDDLVPEGLLYALLYMNFHDLLKMEQVCRYLRNRIKSDALLWRQLHVELPMSNSLTDEILLELASRSKGQLQCLSLVDCTRVTEAALEEIVLSNPRLVKLALPGCSRISADAVVRMVEGHMNWKTARSMTLKQLRVRNMDGFTKEHLERLQKIIGVKTKDGSCTRKLQFYHQKHYIPFQDDDRAIDVEVCPKCNNVRLVYDCTRERCQQKKGTSECRACILCVVRCEACGRCITDNNYEETFALDVLCSCCWLGSPKCAECNRPDICNYAKYGIRTPETNAICYENLPKTER